jgi:hypothetical protein
MSDEKPNPFDDVRRGLGLLFRAAKTTVEKLPRKDLEEVVVTSAREVGRAIENVGRTIEREVFGKRDEARSRGPHGDPHEHTGEHAGDDRRPEEGKTEQRSQRPSEPPDDPRPPDAA